MDIKTLKQSIKKLLSEKKIFLALIALLLFLPIILIDAMQCNNSKKSFVVWLLIQLLFLVLVYLIFT